MKLLIKFVFILILITCIFRPVPVLRLNEGLFNSMGSLQKDLNVCVLAPHSNMGWDGEYDVLDTCAIAFICRTLPLVLLRQEDDTFFFNAYESQKPFLDKSHSHTQPCQLDCCIHTKVRCDCIVETDCTASFCQCITFVSYAHMYCTDDYCIQTIHGIAYTKIEQIKNFILIMVNDAMRKVLYFCV